MESSKLTKESTMKAYLHKKMWHKNTVSTDSQLVLNK